MGIQLKQGVGWDWDTTTMMTMMMTTMASLFLALAYLSWALTPQLLWHQISKVSGPLVGIILWAIKCYVSYLPKGL